MPKKSAYASTLPASKETVRLVRLYCMIHQIPVHQYIAELIEEDMGGFKERLNSLKGVD